MPQARFFQISDLHLGAPFAWLPAERREQRRREQQRALEDSVSRAIERGADAILVAGDLFDKEGVDAETLAFAVHAFNVVGCPPVFIVPGNHDPWSESSPHWSPRLLRARGWAWPAHVHVFTTAGWSCLPLPRQPVLIWGRCHTSNVPSAERPLDPRSFPPAADSKPDRLHVAMFHGSREGHCPPGQKFSAPFSDEEARQSPFAYMAVGHYHTPQRLEGGLGADGGGAAGASGETADASVRLAYAGSLVALETNETGPHGALEVRIRYGSRPAVAEIEPIELDRRRMHELSMDVTGAASADQVDRRVAEALVLAGISDQDIATVRLTGRMIRGVRYTGGGADLGNRAFHLRFDLRNVRPDYDLDSYRNGGAGTTEERFAKALLERLDQEHDPEQRALIERALYYGLDAFKLRQVTPGYEDLGG